MKKRLVKNFLVWTAFFNWPPVLYAIPAFGTLFLLPFLFWLNIPAQWFGLAKLVGAQHFEISEFGAMPQTPLAWILIVAFWVMVAIAFTLLSAVWSRAVDQSRKKTVAAS